MRHIRYISQRGQEMSFRASGASTGRRAKAQRICLECLRPALPDEKKCECGGAMERFDSLAEAKHYYLLRLRQKAGEIFALQCHPKFELNVLPNDYNGHEGIHVCSYSPDFSYKVKDPYYPNGVTVYDEIKPGKLVKTGKMKGQKKPIMTADAALKIKLFQAIYGVKVNIIC